MDEPADVIVHLSADVYQDQFDFVAIAHDVIADIESQSSDDVVRAQVQLLLSIVGKDLLKLHALVKVVNAKMESQLTWAETAAVRFYRALFDSIDPALELEVVCDDSIMGADIAVMYILAAAEEFITQPNWGSERVNVLEFAISLIKACSVGEHESNIAKSIGCSLFEKMAKSLYLPFGENYDIFSIFTYEIVPLLDTAGEGKRSSRVTGILKALKEEDYERTNEQKAHLKQMCTLLGRSYLYQQPTESTADERTYGQSPVGLISSSELEQEVATSLDLFATTPDWDWPAIDRLLKSISKVMKTGAPSSVQIVTLDTIEVMIRSKYLFSHKNLQVLVFFMFSLTPGLDGMADTRQSERLAAFLNDLCVHSGVQTVQDRDSIDSLCRKFGRTFDDVAVQFMGDMFEEDELSKATSKLDIE